MSDVAKAPEAPKDTSLEQAAGNLLDRIDRSLDTEEEDRVVKERLKHPFIRWAFGSMIVLLFFVFITYFLSFYLKIPLPDTQLLDHFMTIVVEVMKIILPSG